MPKVTVNFDLPEEQNEYRLYNLAPKYANVCYEFTNFLRNKVKYGDSKKDPGSWEEAYTEWWNHLKDEGVDPYEA